MSFKRIYVDNLLAEAIADTEGLPADEAIRRSEAGLADLSDACRARMDGLVAELSDAAGRRTDTEAERMRLLAAVASRLIGIGSIAGRPSVDEAAACLCAVADRMLETATFDPDGADAHVWMIRRLASGEVTPAEEAAMLEALQALRLRLGATPCLADGAMACSRKADQTH